jgi:hypothetical protein
VDKKLTVYKTKKVVEAGYRLTLNEQRVVKATYKAVFHQIKTCYGDNTSNQ